jgi:hypothetical protein
MSKGRARIVVRLSGTEMLAVQAAASVMQVDVKRLAKIGLLKEAMDIRNKLIAQMKEEHAREEDTGAALSGSESSGISGSTLVEQSQGSDNTGAQP